MDREQARQEALRRAKRKRMGRPTQAPMTAGPIPKRRMSLSQMERLIFAAQELFLLIVLADALP